MKLTRTENLLTITKMKLNHVKMRSNILTWFSFILVHFDQATSDRNICKMYPYLYKILNMQKMLGLQLTGYIYIYIYMYVYK